jgi:hypothetical protein
MASSSKEPEASGRPQTLFRQGMQCVFGGCLMVIALGLLVVGVAALIAGLRL